MSDIIDFTATHLLRTHVGDNRALEAYAPHVPKALIVPDFPGERCFPERDLSVWCRREPHLVVVHHEEIERVSLVLFRVHHHQKYQNDVVVQDLVIEVLACADSAMTSDRQVVVEFLKPGDDQSVNYRHKFHESLGHRTDTIELFLPDILFRDPGHVERLTERIALIGQVLCSREPQ